MLCVYTEKEEESNNSTPMDTLSANNSMLLRAGDFLDRQASMISGGSSFDSTGALPVGFDATTVSVDQQNMVLAHLGLLGRC